MKKVLISGGCGFLGSNIAYFIKDAGYEVSVIDNLSRYGSAENLKWLQSGMSLRFFNGDVRDAETVASVIREVMPDVVFHLAGQVAMTTSLANPRLDFEINALGTLNMLEALRVYKPDAAIIYSSTNKVYGDLEQYTFEEQALRYRVPEKPDGFDEQERLNFHSPYGCSKGCADQYILDFSRLYGIKGIVFRHSTIYGGRQFATFDQGWIGWFCQQAVAIKADPDRKPFTIAGNGKQVRDVLHAEDAVRLYTSCIELADTLKGEVFNVGGGVENSLSLLELFSMLERELSIQMKYEQLPPRESDQKLFIADISKVKQMVGWAPKIDCLTGVRKMLLWSSELSGN
ncbi:GDP-mannose 4,6-dehydratase [Rurimicrobium arvi]|uniref:CDP-paratose 2-epimerase n=1 Tax=Rurimicrobium arvi TaxID=2049916 RepID=A0ABP8MF24_9BACT